MHYFHEKENLPPFFLLISNFSLSVVQFMYIKTSYDIDTFAINFHYSIDTCINIANIILALLLPWQKITNATVIWMKEDLSLIVHEKLYGYLRMHKMKVLVHCIVSLWSSD